MLRNDYDDSRVTGLDDEAHNVDASYERRMREALECSRDDFLQGRFYDSREALMEAVAEMRAGTIK